MLLQKIGETFQDLQSHSFSIITLGEQWKRLQSSIGTIHRSVEEKVNVVESKDREINMNRIRLQNFKKEVENRQKNLEVEENSLKQRIEGVEMREKQVKEWCECLELQRREIAERVEKVEVCEKQFAEGFERVKAVDVAEVRVSERRKAVEERENEVVAREKETKAAAEKVGLREEVMNERGDELDAKEIKLKEFSEEVNRRFVLLEEKEERLGLTEKEIDELYSAMREEQMNEKIDAFEVKVAQIDGVCKGMVVKRCEMAKMKKAMMEEVKVMEGKIEERRKVVEEREKQMDDRCRELDCREKMLNERGKDIDFLTRPTSSALAKTREPKPVACCEIQLLCRNMDTYGMRSYLIKLHCKDIYNMRDDISESLQLSPDPAKLVFNVIQSFYELVESESTLRQPYIACCTTLSGALLLLNTSVTPHLKDDAMKFSIKWRDFFAKQGYIHRLDTFAFLQFLATYDLAQSYDANELFSHLRAFFTESEALLSGQGVYLCQILGLEKKIPGMLNLYMHLHLKFSRTDGFTPDKTHLLKEVNKMMLSTWNYLPSEPCLNAFPISSSSPSFSPAPLESRIKLLEKEMEGKANAESILTVKKNISDSERKGVALPGFDQSHLAMGKKHTLNSMESRKQRKIFKVNVI
uniref:FRIGIDA-like protein n=1 Tax=Chenopodium quinoa TaxID=63459 RepID=A0A803KPG7_CHEQI